MYVSRAPFGLAACTATMPGGWRRWLNVTHRIAAYCRAVIAPSPAGLVWGHFTGTTGAVVDILVIAVVGGINRPIGPFVGALVYVLLRTFSIDALEAAGLDGKRFQLVIGLGFLIVLLFSPDGLVGIWQRIRPRLFGRRDAEGGGR